MLRTLNRIGSRITRLFGDPKPGADPVSPIGLGDTQSVFEHDVLSTILPFQAYDPEAGIFIGRNSQGFTIEAHPLVGTDEAVQKELLNLFQEVLQEGASIQCMLWADHRIEPFLSWWGQARKGSDEIFQELAHKRSEFLQSPSKGTNRIFRFILSYSMPRCEKNEAKQLTKLQEAKDRLLKALSSLSYAYAWKPDHFLSTVGGMVNFDPSAQAHQRRWNPYETLASQLPTGGHLRVSDDHLTWEGDQETRFRTYRLVDTPQEWSLTGMHHLIGDAFREAFRVQAPFFLHYGVHMPSQSKVEGSFRRKSQLIENQGKSSTLCRLIPDLVDELDECDFVRRSTRTGNHFVWTQFSAGLWAPPDQIASQEQALKSLFRIHQFVLRENRRAHLPCFLSSLPMTWAEYAPELKKLDLLKTTITSECANFVPIQGEWMGTTSPGMLLSGRRGQLLNWNPFDNKAGNYNAVVVGRSGSGKSVFMQDLLISGLGTGARVFVLEVGRSFEKMAHLLDGQHIEFSRKTPICLNPFTRIAGHDEEERLAAFAMLKAILACMASPGEGTNDYQNALLEKAISHAWEAKGNQATITTVADWLSHQEDSDSQILGTMLTPYCEGGVHARYFEGENNVDFTSTMVLIELEELKEKKDLQAVVLQLFIMAITNQAFLGDRKTPFYICIDEAWDLLRGKQTGIFIETLARRLRKYNGSLVIGTQSIDDFFAAPGALAAFENSDWMCLLAQKKSSVSRLSESGKVQMTEGMRHALESVTTRHGAFSEVMICDADGNYAIARLVLDRFSQLLYTTKADEYSKLKELQGQGLTIVEAIDRLSQASKEGNRC